MKLVARPISIAAAKTFIRLRHRHHPHLTGGKFAVSVTMNGRVVGVAVAGRPKSIMTEKSDPLMGEVTRVCTDGTPGACSFLYSRCRRIMQLMGYERFQSFVLLDELGKSIEADGWKCIGITDGGSWSRPSRARVDKSPTTKKRKYQYFGAA